MAAVVPIDRPGVSHSASQIISQGDLIYANIRVNFDRDSVVRQRIEYDVHRAAPILADPSQYEMTILRFTLPSTLIELFKFTPDRPHLVSMEWDGVAITKDISDFVQQILDPPEAQKTVYGYQQYVDGVNQAMKEAYADLLAAKPALPASGVPILLLNPATGLFSIRADVSWSDPTDPLRYSANTAKLYFNFEALRLFQSIPVFEQVNDPILNEQIIFRDMGNNTQIAGTYEMISNYDTRGLWNSITQIVFDSSMPVQSEILPGQAANTRRILTDFEPNRGEPANRSAFQYQPSGERRWYSMRSSTPLHRIDVIPKWVDDTGKVNPFYLGTGDFFAMKILFRKKAYARTGPAPAYFDQPSARF
jgi:hypothetical protein